MYAISTIWLRRALLTLACVVAPVAAANAQEAPPVPPAEAPPADAPLVTEQKQVSDKFRELNKLMLRMAELTAPTDPKRAALLRRAVAQSGQRGIEGQFDELIALLRQERLSVALKSQGQVQEDLAKLLELLLSEDRSKRIETEKERIRAYLKRVNRIIKDQKGLQRETARQGDPRELGDRQAGLAEETGELAKDVGEDAGKTPPNEKPEGDEKRDPPGEKKPGEPGKDGSDKEKPADGDSKGQPGEPSKDKPGKDEKDSDKEKDDSAKEKDETQKDTEGKEKNGEEKDSKDGSSKDSKGKQSESKPADGKPSESKPSDGKPSDSKPSDQPPSEGQPGDQQQSQQQQSPAQQRLEKAQQRMQEAQEKLEQAKRDDATEKQEEALRELEQAKADLEEILRQLREEEVARTLAMLEARFRKMLDAQVAVYEGTKRVDQVAQADRDRDDEVESGRLGRKELEITAEADKALTLLREEGSAVAMPEAVLEMRDDMNQVAQRLSQFKVDAMTQGIEKDIITALEEMIASLKKAQKDMENQKNQGQQQQAGEGDEQPLVDSLAEIRMIRALQMRVNTRTQRYAEMTKTEQVDTPELLEALKNLAEREERIHKVTRDIVVGRNR